MASKTTDHAQDSISYRKESQDITINLRNCLCLPRNKTSQGQPGVERGRQVQVPADGSQQEPGGAGVWAGGDGRGGGGGHEAGGHLRDGQGHVSGRGTPTDGGG